MITIDAKLDIKRNYDNFNNYMYKSVIKTYYSKIYILIEQ